MFGAPVATLINRERESDGPQPVAPCNRMADAAACRSGASFRKRLPNSEEG
jgi:hypothetical protein